jgi:hypothetical protein
VYHHYTPSSTNVFSAFLQLPQIAINPFDRFDRSPDRFFRAFSCYHRQNPMANFSRLPEVLVDPHPLATVPE